MTMMTGRSLAWRLGGAALIAAAGGSSLLHRHVIDTAARQPASALEMGLGLLSFILASVGVLLLIQGERLRDALLEDMDRRHRDDVVDEQRVAARIDPAAFGADRVALAAYLARRVEAGASGRERSGR